MHKKVICAFVLAVLVCASAWADVPLTAEYFPDDTFREYISTNFDNGDGVLSDAEIEQVTALPVGLTYSYDRLSDVLTSSPSNELSTVHDFTGIEYLTSLEALYYEELFRFGQQNLLADVDLSKNTRLRFLHFIPAGLSSLDLSANAALLYVECQESGLSSLNVSGCSGLVYLNCSNNSLSALDVSGSMSLIHLDFSNNSVADINLSWHSRLQYLFCANNDLSELLLPVDDAELLRRLNCSNNHLPRLRLESYYVLNTPDCSSQSITGSYVTQTGNNYTFDMSTLIPSDELSRVSNVEAYDSTGNTISIITDGGGGIIIYHPRRQG